MLFRTMATTELPHQIEWAYLVSYFGGGYGAWLIGSLALLIVAIVRVRRFGSTPSVVEPAAPA